MKRKVRWLLLLIPLALFAWAYQAASWRPKLVGAQKGATPVDVMTQGQLLLSPDGKRLVSFALWRLNKVNSVPGRGLTVWDLSTHRATHRMVWQQKSVAVGWMKPLGFSPDSRLLAVISDWDAFGRPNRVVDILNASSGELQRRIVSVDDREIQSTAFLSNRALVTSTSQGAAVVDVQTGETVRQWKFRAVAFGSGPRVYAPQSAVSADGKTILALANGRDVSLYDCATGHKKRAWKLDGVHRNPRLSPDGKLWIAQRAKDDLADIYDVQTGKKLWGPFVADNAAFPWIWSADGQQILTSFDTRMALIDARTGHDLRRLNGNDKTQALALAPNNDYFYTLDNQGVIWRWRAR